MTSRTLCPAATSVRAAALNTVANAYFDGLFGRRADGGVQTDLPASTARTPTNSIVANAAGSSSTGRTFWWPQRTREASEPLERFADIPQNR
jgi:hypothetical protein